jgi:hypothetical protein
MNEENFPHPLSKPLKTDVFSVILVFHILPVPIQAMRFTPAVKKEEYLS